MSASFVDDVEIGECRWRVEERELLLAEGLS
jgi:hypothetical protein